MKEIVMKHGARDTTLRGTAILYGRDLPDPHVLAIGTLDHQIHDPELPHRARAAGAHVLEQLVDNIAAICMEPPPEDPVIDVSFTCFML